MDARSRAGVVIAGVVALCAAVLAIRGCGDDAPSAPPAPAVTEAPAEPAAPGPRPRVVAPAPPVAEAAPVAASAAEPAPPVSEGAVALRRLEAEGLKVRVTSGGHPVHDAEFRIGPVGGELAPVTAMGSFSSAPGCTFLDVGERPAFPLTLSVRSEGRGERRVQVDSRNEIVVVDLPVGGRIEATLRRANGVAVERAQVVIGGRTATTDVLGRFTIDPIEPGRYASASIAAGGAWRAVACDIDIPAPGDVRQAALVIPASTPLRVRVVRASDGTSVAGARVRVVAMDGGEAAEATARTGDDGRVVIGDLRDGEFLCWAWGDDVDIAMRDSVRVPCDEEIELRAPPAATHFLRGRIVDAKGAPVAGVGLIVWGGSDSTAVRATTDADGRFEILGVRGWPSNHVAAMHGTYFPLWPNAHLVAPRTQRRAGETPWLAPHQVFLEPDRDTEIVLPALVRVKALVVDGAGGPLPKVRFTYHSRSNWWVALPEPVAAPGAKSLRVVVPDAPAEPGTLIAWTDDGRVGALAVTPSATGETDAGRLTLHPARTIVVRDPGTGERTQATILRRRASGYGWERLHPARDMDLSTWLAAQSCEPGTWRCLALAHGRLATDLGDVVVREDVAQTVVDAHLSRPAEVQVVVRRGAVVVAGADVACEFPDASATVFDLRTILWWVPHGDGVHRASGPGIDLESRTSAEGRAAFRRLPAGRFRVHVRDPQGGARTTVEGELAEGDARVLEVDLER